VTAICTPGDSPSLVANAGVEDDGRDDGGAVAAAAGAEAAGAVAAEACGDAAAADGFWAGGWDCPQPENTTGSSSVARVARKDKRALVAEFP